ncbi:Translocation protein sec62 [Smittium culicis]|uniref:Translocation protein SEC62 n=1 Tax=Smittium culicis TaxID=133412 RepID=A0A1R1YDD0_9FUNG|nr:Translocation protein sec62 [Smittium culicis]OMJ24917.1 Translocation protein sec62 [Smittium culicis]
MAEKDVVNETAPKEVYKLADFLLSSGSGLRKREGVINGRRANYFKGKSAINALTKSIGDKAPYFSGQVEAIEQLSLLLDWQLIVRCDKNEEDGRTLRPSPLQTFSEEYYYAWLYQGSPLRIILGGIGLVLIVLAGVMFPLWPSSLRQISYYLSLCAFGFLGLLFVIAIIRLIVYVISIFTHPPGLWIFPNLFEDVGFFESFVPLYAWEVPKADKKKKAAAKSSTSSATTESTNAPSKNDTTASAVSTAKPKQPATVTKRNSRVEEADDE